MLKPSGAVGRRQWLRWLTGVVVLGFILQVAWELADGVDLSRVQVSWPGVVLALLPTAAAMLFQLLGWRSLIAGMSAAAVPLMPAAVLYLDSQLARYTPGKLGLLAVRVAGAGKLGVAPRIIGSSLLLEMASWAGVGLFVGFALLRLVGSFAGAPPVEAGLMALVSSGSLVITSGAFVGLLTLSALSRRCYPTWFRQLLLGPNAEELGVVGPLVPWTLPAWHLLSWLSWALAGALLAQALGGSSAACAGAGAVVVIAVVLGFLAVFAPAGAGVREAVISAGAAPLLGPSAALTLGLFARVLSLAADVLFWALVRWLDRRSRGRSGGAIRPTSRLP